jgi:hypothetical protein
MNGSSNQAGREWGFVPDDLIEVGGKRFDQNMGWEKGYAESYDAIVREMHAHGRKGRATAKEILGSRIKWCDRLGPVRILGVLISQGQLRNITAESETKVDGAEENT